MENTYAGKLGVYPEKVTRKLGVEVSLGVGCAEEGALDRKAALAEAERDADGKAPVSEVDMAVRSGMGFANHLVQ